MSAHARQTGAAASVPAERQLPTEDVRNASLDAWAAMTRLLVDLGLEPQLTARLGHLLAAPPASATPMPAASEFDTIELANLLSACIEGANLRGVTGATRARFQLFGQRLQAVLASRGVPIKRKPAAEA